MVTEYLSARIKGQIGKISLSAAPPCGVLNFAFGGGYNGGKGGLAAACGHCAAHYRCTEQLKKLGGLVYGGGNGGAGSVGAVGYSYGICANINGGKRAVPVGQLLRKGGAVPAAAGEYRAQRHGKIPYAGGMKLYNLHRWGAAQHPEAGAQAVGGAQRCHAAIGGFNKG